MVRTIAILIAASLLSSSCSTVRRNERLMTGVGTGAGSGALGGALLSPNAESRGLNALVFGLSGALVGGTIALLTGADSDTKTPASDLKNRELQSSSSGREFVVQPHQELPAFLKNRIQPVVIEEFVETDQTGEDGSLHEPHKVYRIKRPAELISRPVGRDASPSPTPSEAAR